MDNEKTTSERAILDAAIKEFSIKGFDGARTSAIASEAGVTHAMLHYYFRTKEKLYEQIIRAKIRDIFTMVLTPMVSGEGDIKVRLRRGIERHFQFLIDNPELPLFLVHTVNSRPEQLHAIFSELPSEATERLTLLQEEIDHAAERGEITGIDVRVLIGDIAALNVFSFLATPLFMAVAGYAPEQKAEFLESRKKETIETIMKRIS